MFLGSILTILYARCDFSKKIDSCCLLKFRTSKMQCKCHDANRIFAWIFYCFVTNELLVSPRRASVVLYVKHERLFLTYVHLIQGNLRESKVHFLKIKHRFFPLIAVIRRPRSPAPGLWEACTGRNFQIKLKTPYLRANLFLICRKWRFRVSL